MADKIIEKASFDFLRKLAKNNTREWFNDHKELYTKAHDNIIEFAGSLLGHMNRHDSIETPSGKQSLYRIYKDVRFSKEKVPYNTCWNGGFKRATKRLRGGYYFHLQPGASFVGGGFWGPNKEDLQRIREDIANNNEEWNKVLSQKTLVKTFGKMQGEQLGTAPRGYAQDHPAIELLRYKQFLLRHDFTDEEVLSPDFAKKASDVFKNMRPFFDHMSEILTTDSNGVSLVD